MTDAFDRYVTPRKASEVTGTPLRTIREWQRKGAIGTYTNAGGRAALVNLDELRPRPKRTTGDATA